MTNKNNTWLAYGIIPAWLLALNFSPYLAMATNHMLPRQVTNLVFFTPQYLFWFLYVVKPKEVGFERLFSETGAVLFGIALWLFASAVFSLLGKRWRIGYCFLLGPFVIAAVAIAVHSMFSVFGYNLQLDGP